MTDPKGPLYLSMAAGIWGGVYVASKYALQTIPPFTLLFIRYLMAALLLIYWCRRSHTALTPIQDKMLLFQIGLFGYFLSIAAQFIGTNLSPAHMGAVITSLSPVFQSGFAILLLGEKISIKQSIAIGLAVVGIFIITGLTGLERTAPFNPGNLFFLGAACLWGFCSILTKKAAQQHSPLQITTWGIIWATLLTLPPALAELNSRVLTALCNWPVILSILYLALVATAIAYFCWNKGLTLTNSHQAGLFFFLQPVVGSILSFLILGEKLSGAFFGGSLLILTGVFFVMRP